jgi:hypothetical protein
MQSMISGRIREAPANILRPNRDRRDREQLSQQRRDSSRSADISLTAPNGRGKLALAIVGPAPNESDMSFDLGAAVNLTQI